MKIDCFECGTTIEAADINELNDRYLEHARAEHKWPYPDQAIRNYAEATQRLTGGSERLPSIGEVSVHPVTEERIDDWLAFFDHDAFVGTPEWAACYCLEPHVREEGEAPTVEAPHWRENREAMVTRLRAGGAFGYLAYVNGKPAGWVNASKRSDYSLYRHVDPGGPEAASVIGVSCFIIAPPYRRHGVAAALLDRVIEDAAVRGAEWIEGYPFTDEPETDAGHFRGPRSLYDERQFERVEVRSRETVVRRRVDPAARDL